jgi:hypothetical protein
MQNLTFEELIKREQQLLVEATCVAAALDDVRKVIRTHPANARALSLSFSSWADIAAADIASWMKISFKTGSIIRCAFGETCLARVNRQFPHHGRSIMLTTAYTVDICEYCCALDPDLIRGALVLREAEYPTTVRIDPLNHSAGETRCQLVLAAIEEYTGRSTTERDPAYEKLLTSYARENGFETIFEEPAADAMQEEGNEDS